MSTEYWFSEPDYDILADGHEDNEAYIIGNARADFFAWCDFNGFCSLQNVKDFMQKNPGLIIMDESDNLVSFDEFRRMIESKSKDFVTAIPSEERKLTMNGDSKHGYITLNDFIGELQKLQKEHGNDEIISIGSCSGMLKGMSSPYSLRFQDGTNEFVPSQQKDVAHIEGPWRPSDPVQRSNRLKRHEVKPEVGMVGTIKDSLSVQIESASARAAETGKGKGSELSL